MKKIIQKELEDKLQKKFKIDSIEILKNKNEDHGEYSTNIAMKFSKQNNKNPREFAELIVETLKDSEFFDNISIAGPGFINFSIKKKVLVDETLKWMDSKYKPNINATGRMLYEFVSANPTGWLHIGHARNAFVGDTFLRIAEYSGIDVYREYYINDAGVQIDNLANSVYQRYLEASGKEINPEDITYGGNEIKDYGIKLFKDNREISNYEEIKQETLDFFLEEIKKTLSNLKIKEFDGWVSENSLYSDGLVDKAIDKLKKSGYAYEKDGALWIKTTDFNDDKDRVIVKSNGEKTYLLADIANHVEKFNKGFDQVINLWGMDHHGYVARVKASVAILGYDVKNLHMDLINMVKIYKNNELFKMSKRKGTSLTINDVLTIMEPDLLRFFILSKSKEQNLDIIYEDIQKQDSSNPYWYSQYAYARCNQLINRYNDENKIDTESEFKYELDSYSMTLMKLILDFDDRIYSILESREPSGIVNYIKELASAFHSFYANVKVGNNNDLIRLVISFKNIYKTLFNLLGIKGLERM